MTARASNTVVIERQVAAAPARVWSCWTEPARLSQWWGPQGWTAECVAFDLRPGGLWRYCLRDAAGGHAPIWGRADFVEVATQARLVFRESRTDAEGEIVDADPRLTSVEFEPSGDGTRIRVTTRFVDRAQRDAFVTRGMRQGYAEAFDRLEGVVASWP